MNFGSAIVCRCLFLKRKKNLIYESVVKETMMSISTYKSELKKLEITVKDQKNLVFQHLSNAQTQIVNFISKNQRGNGLINIADCFDYLDYLDQSLNFYFKV